MSGHKEKFITPDALNEEYYQISPEILKKFPRHRPPLTLYIFKEEVASLLPFYTPGQMLNKARQEELENLCTVGNVFVSRTDHPIYARHISEQLDLVLLDKNLKEKEIIEIFTYALPRRIQEFLDQPVAVVWERLSSDILVLSEYLSADPFRIKGLLKKLFTEYDLAKHEFNVGMVGLAIYLVQGKENIKKKFLDRLALGLFLHDVGLTKIPSFVLDKKQALSTDEQNKILAHPMNGAKVCRKLGIGWDEVFQCILEHHERLDGSGYPQRKGSTDISIPGRICAIADSFSAMISERPYSEAKSKDQAAAELLNDGRYDSKLTARLQRIVMELSSPLNTH